MPTTSQSMSLGESAATFAAGIAKYELSQQEPAAVGSGGEQEAHRGTPVSTTSEQVSFRFII